jgi:acetyltransferase-like isoleucine patch superfamily enzyme
VSGARIRTSAAARWSLVAVSLLRATWLRIRNRGASIRLNGLVYFGPRTDLRLAPGTTFVAGDRVHLRRNCVFELNDRGRVEIGADTQFTYNCVVQCSTSVTIGERCIIGAALIVDGKHRFRDTGVPILEQGYDFRPITIGNDAWIGIGAVVMADVGERAVVGANAVVVDPVPPFTVVGGVPAKTLSAIDKAL